eukprot:CAMPEP_0172698658 /NCGR_PEP_ID=MMETSP1074-20121228/29635_1 /TAXON_ID=2916 /ORGANISM="Ceratium fusus, Strain PA161109" /LENGTH=89 /DNA_ID=CAMNT_0013519733 /DNA_START=189 /DNA_END=458 /DNA_ORIENTATION=+
MDVQPLESKGQFCTRALKSDAPLHLSQHLDKEALHELVSLFSHFLSFRGAEPRQQLEEFLEEVGDAVFSAGILFDDVLFPQMVAEGGGI